MMKNNKPSISVIIPVYNCEMYLAEAIQSVLSQSYKPLEIIIVDDGSTDSSARIVDDCNSPLVQYSLKQHLGAGAARNHGMQLARGDFFAFLDSDDLWEPEKLKYQVDVFNQQPEIDIVFGHLLQFISPELAEDVIHKLRNSTVPIPGYSVISMLTRRKVISTVGKFATNLQEGEFIDWYSKANDQGLKSFMLPNVVAKRRVHKGNIGIRGNNNNYLKIVRKAIQRRRKQGYEENIF